MNEMTQFDPSYGYDLSTLLEVEAPQSSERFCRFWRANFERLKQHKPKPKIRHTGEVVGKFELYSFCYFSTDHVEIKGWALIPSASPVNKVIIVGHGYGGCNEPEGGEVPVDDCAYLYICYRGISRSATETIPENPDSHVLHNIDDKDNYVIRGCVDDTWLAVSAAEILFPAAKDHIGYMGISFSGGIGALATAWDKRIKKLHIQVPTFGHQPLRLELPSLGSAKAVQNLYQKHPFVVDTLSFYDSAVAAAHITVPVHVAAALEDPYVAPPGQFSIYNNLRSEKALYVLDKGHMDYPEYKTQQTELMNELSMFFADL
jgi:cephalosporin-C deacetylase